MRTRIDVSPEMLAFVGEGDIDPESWPDRPIALIFDLAAATFSLNPDPAPADFPGSGPLLIVAREACARIFGAVPEAPAAWHLPTDMRAIALSLRDCPLAEPARATFRLAKSIELLCAAFARFADASLVPAVPSGAVTAVVAERIVAARRMIDECWHEKLTLASIARACGLNRAALTHGFRTMFDCSVADAIAERRMAGAREMLLVTDLSIASIGHACGYLNNASFTRAFSRRFGLAPTRLRAAA